MIEAGTRIVRRLRLSGFIGSDFMIEDDAYLIEMNLRATQITGLVREAAPDPIAAYYKAIVDAPTTPRRPLDGRIISLALAAAAARLSRAASRQHGCRA